MATKSKSEIVKSIKEFCKIDEIPLDAITFPYEYSPLTDYINLLSVKVKPETAASQLIFTLMKDIFESSISPEVNFDGSFIDFVVKEKGANNPILIELKPLFQINATKDKLTKRQFDFKSHQDQIQKYLSKKSVEYVVLTNIDKAFVFNRSALIDFKPFYESTFSELLNGYLQYNDLWDTIRRLEDDNKPLGLDDSFFQDLKKWFAQFENVKFNEVTGKFNQNELIVILLNKLIFIKTLEDFGLIPYRMLQNKFENYADAWISRGNYFVFEAFFNDIEKYFEILYNTELFSTHIWDYFDKSKSNLDLFRSQFEIVLGLDNWSKTFGKGLVHYNYRLIDEDIFGKAYETWIAENQKDEGIYYTPVTITEYMAEQIVDTLFKEKVDILLAELRKSDVTLEKVSPLLNQIFDIRIIDSTSGSGSFMIKVIRKIFDYYIKIKHETDWITQLNMQNVDNIFSIPENLKTIDAVRNIFSISDTQTLISRLILNHIYGADKDERAIDTAKTNIWKEAIKLNPHSYSYKQLKHDRDHILPNLEMNFIKGDSLNDFDFEEQINIIHSEFQDDLIKLFEIRKTYLNNVYNPSVIQQLVEIKDKIRNRLIENHKFKNSLFYPLEFFFCYFDENGEPKPIDKRGFDGIISNPPWEAIKPVKKEFARMDKYQMDVLHFNEWFADKLKNDLEFHSNWDDYTNNYTEYTTYLYDKYKLQSSGDPNYYKFFIERDFQLIKQNGYFCLLVPSGFQTDEGSSKLRELLITKYHLIELNSFENKGYKDPNKKNKIKLFPDVHPQYKFSIIFARKENLNGHKHSFRAKFYLHDPNDLKNGNTIQYDIEKIKQFSPENLSIMEFRSEKDYEVCLKIKDNHKLLKDSEIKFRREFDMTNDSNLFMREINVKKLESKPLRLYEGKMIHQFTSSFANPRYFIDETNAREVLLRKVKHRIKSENNLSREDFEKLSIPEDLLLDYQTYRLAFRAIGRSTDERTLIASILPENVYVGHSMNNSVNVSYSIKNEDIIFDLIESEKLIYIMSLFNSLTVNYYIRNKVSANLTMNFINELPIAETDDETKADIVKLGFSLLYRKSNSKEYDELKKILNVEIDFERELTEIRADLEIIIAKKLYKLDLEDWKYICSTFTYGESDTRAELDEIIKISLNKW